MINVSTIPALNIERVLTPPEDRYAIVARDILRKSLAGLWSPVGLSTAVELAAASIEIMPDERPRPDCGLLFVSLQGSSRAETTENSRTEYVTLTVHVTLRTSSIPKDRVGKNSMIMSLYSAETPRRVLSHVTNAITQSIENNGTALLTIANSLLPNDPPLLHELRLAQRQKPRTVGPSHFMSAPGLEQSDSGLLQSLTFTKGLWQTSCTPT